MLDRLIDFFVSVLDLFRFFQVVAVYERGVLLRLGKFVRVLEPGLHWVWPMNVDRVIVDNVVRRTLRLRPQALVTSDGKLVGVEGLALISIGNIRVATLNVEGIDHAMEDSCAGSIADHVATHTWDQLRTPESAQSLTKACRSRARQYGLRVHRVTLAGLAPTRSITHQGIDFHGITIYNAPSPN